MPRAVTSTLAMLIAVFAVILVINPGGVKAQTAYSLLLSSEPDRSATVALDGQTVSGDIYVFTSPDSGVQRVRFYLDNPTMSGNPTKTEWGAPYDFAGTGSAGALPFDTTSVSDGTHSITAAIDLAAGGTEVLSASFYVLNTAPQLTFDFSEITFALEEGETDTASAQLQTTDGQPADFELSTPTAPWLTVAADSSTTPATVDVTVDAAGLAEGTHVGSIDASAAGYPDVTLTVTLQVGSIFVSTSSDRSNPISLDGQTVAESIYVFTATRPGISRVEFYLDDPEMTAAPRQTEGGAPYDFAGGTWNGLAMPFDTRTVANGEHTIAAAVTLTSGAEEVLHATFTVANEAPALELTPAALALNVTEGSSTSGSASLTTNTGQSVAFTVAAPSAPWVTVIANTTSTPATLTATVDSGDLEPGTYEDSIEITADGHTSVVLPITMTVSPPDTGTGTYVLQLSTAPDRSAPVPLQDASATGSIYVFTSPDEDVDDVEFYLDDPTMSGAPLVVEGSGPFDFAGTATNGSALPFDTRTLVNGQHTITALLELTSGGTDIATATFTVSNVPSLGFAPDGVTVNVAQGGTGSAVSTLAVSDGESVDYTLSAPTAAWLTVSADSTSTPATVTANVDAAGLATGSYTASVTASADGYDDANLTVTLNVETEGGGTYTLSVSEAADRSNSVALSGYTAVGSIYVFTSPDSGVSSVKFYLDDPTMSGTPRQTEGTGPYDFAGSAGNGGGNPFDTTTIADGEHTITAQISLSAGGSEVVHGTFTVANNAPALQFAPTDLTFSVPTAGGTASDSATITLSDGASVPYTLTPPSGASWLTVTADSTSTPATATITVDSTGLADGTYTATIEASADNYLPGTLRVTLQVGEALCGMVPCGDVKISVPYVLDFSADHGFIPDGAGTGTGFTWLDEPTNGTGYIPGNIALDLAAGTLSITTTKGLSTGSTNSLDNALGVGIDVPSQVSLISTRLLAPPSGSGNYEQAGLWFGVDEDNYVKLTLLSDPNGTIVESYLEVNGGRQIGYRSPVVSVTSDIELMLRVDPNTQTVTPFYAVNGGAMQSLAAMTPPEEFFSFDAAGIDPRIGTRSFSGVFASHRHASTPLTYAFDEFSVTKEERPPVNLAGINWQKSSFDVPFPTSIVWGPDDRLYVLEMFGTIHAITLGDDKQPIDDEVITTLGSRLALGITIDPESTPENVILWVSHSSPSINDGTPNSSTVTRLSGPGFTERQDVITGLPRAIANHAVNSLHFGPDGRLYIAVGGNTGAGAPNEANTEFGDMEEQPLSAAMLVADVKATGFDGSCNNPDDIFGPPPCDVTTYATGTRNMYDFTFHSNGQLYGTDNGLGVAGSFPPSPTPPCTGLASSAPWDEGGQNPGTQPDVLNRIVEGGYYGHPNPYRDECVFKDGSYQGVPAPSNYQPPLHNLGDHRSSNGVVEYTFDAFFGALRGELLISNYSIGDNIVRVRLTEDGMGVIESGTLIDGVENPLPLALGPDGTIYVGELEAGRVTAFDPRYGRWFPGTAMPSPRHETAAAVVGNRFYVIGGHIGSPNDQRVEEYDVTTGTWRTMADLPEPLDHMMLAVVNDVIYVFGGIEAYPGPVSSDVYRFDPNAGATGNWTHVGTMPEPVGGAAIGVHNGLVYIAGGFTDNHDVSLKANTSWRWDPATGVWEQLPDLPTYRDHLSGQVIGDRFYTVGGRQDGDLFGHMGTFEAFDIPTGTWVTLADMPTSRRGLSTTVLDGKLIAFGGEKNPDTASGVFDAVEAYDPVAQTWSNLAPMPTPRHSPAIATIDGRAYVVGGSAQEGASPTDVMEIFTFGQRP